MARGFCWEGRSTQADYNRIRRINKLFSLAGSQSVTAIISRDSLDERSELSCGCLNRVGIPGFERFAAA